MSLLRHLRALLLPGALALVSAASLHAQSEIKGGVANDLSYRAGGIPTGPGGTPSGAPTITPQFSNVVETSASAGPLSTSGNLSARYPSSANAVLQRASVGTTFASGVPRYFLGDRISPPTSYLNAGGNVVATPAGFWRGEPVRAAEVTINPSGQPLKDAAGVVVPNTGGVIVPALAPGVYETFYYSPHAVAVFACQPGQVQIWWRSNLPDANNSYIFVRETFSVSSTTSSPVRAFYWTEKSFNGPRVTIPSGRIVTVNPVFSNVFPAAVATEYASVGSSQPADPNAQPASELRTVWFEKTNGVGELHAYNYSGRILVEYLGALRDDGSHEFLGADIVEVAPTAFATTLTVYLGDEIRPAIDTSPLLAMPVTTSSSSSNINYYGSTVRADGSLSYFAERENTLEDRVLVYWLEQLDAAIHPSTALPPGLELNWPKYLHKYLQLWPTDFSRFVYYTVGHTGSTTLNGTGLKFEGGKIPALVYQDDPEQDEAYIDTLTQRFLVQLSGDLLNRSLLKFTGDNGGVWYVRLFTQADDRPGFVESDGKPALSGVAYVGDRLAPPSSDYTLAGYVAGGTAYSPLAYKDPFALGVAAAAQGAIIPVNALPAGGSSLKVWWFRKVTAPASEFADFYTPSKVGRYTLSYRTDNPKIVLASNAGGGDLSPTQAAGFLYVQNDATQPGYNPNEEHALLLNGRAYALRDDLNILTGSAFTSLPRVLLHYTDPADNRPAIRAFEVLRDDTSHKFDYAVTAGTILQAPLPLPLLPLPVDPATGRTRNTEVTPDPTLYPPESLVSGLPADTAKTYSKFTFKDRKGYDWVYRGPHASSTTTSPALGMQWYYTLRAGFFIPGLALSAQPAEGTLQPYLRAKNSSGGYDPATAGVPLTVIYRPAWPADAPTMSVGETLSLANHGLPTVRGQTSAFVLYQQSIAQTGAATASVTLHDGTRAKTILLNAANVGLSKLPSSVATTAQSGKTYFQLLPPHLQPRVYFDGTLGTVGGVVLTGRFFDEISGEDYLDLNALSADDVIALKALCATTDGDYQKWSNVIDGLATKVETFIEDPSRKGTYIVDSAQTVTVTGTALAAISKADTAVDSYALTATGAGAGHVSLVFGDGAAFTPAGDPVSVSVVRIVPQLYTGDLKTLPAANPLDEQTSLRHSGDFAARPENYEFDWRYSPPQDGVQPATYTYTLGTALGLAPANLWFLAFNPPAALPSSYPATQYEFPRTFAINTGTYTAGAGRPGAVAKSVGGLALAGAVPAQIVFSATLGTNDGFILYVNGTAALASRLPAGFATPAGLTAVDPRSDLSPTGLANQYTVPPAYFIVGTNRIEVALCSSASLNATSSLAFRLDVSTETDKVVASGSSWTKPNGTLSNIVVVGGSATSPLSSPLLVFGDNYFTMRYRPKTGVTNVAGTGWSRWMAPRLVESWIKRALEGINPFTQRTDDLYNNPVSTDVSILTQAGKRWEGDVALNLNNINDFGLIEIYETLLNRAKKLSIDAGFNDPGTNDTLLLVTGYLSDLYTSLGDEASDDATNPTISIDGTVNTSVVNTARFSFETQVPNLISEELALLRGRDDFLNPGVTAAPGYNRLYWNYTNGVDSGESIYAINYDIKEKAGGPSANGKIDASDAQYLFPQAHGDAYGHYLTALKGYYKLLTSPNFSWVPRTESVSILGQTVQVDYRDERKFAADAAAVARIGAQVLEVTARDAYRDDPAVGWAHQRDVSKSPLTGIARRWGTDEWAARTGLGAYLHWVSANAMLPDVDNNPQHSGIQIIDRGTVPEISELVSSGLAIQATLDNQAAHLNPLGLANGAIAFDLSPTDLKAGKSHYEQIYERALRAALNAKAAFDQACVMNALLRNQNNSFDDYHDAIDDQEDAYNYQLIDLFGTPYAGDIGPGKLYAQGYTGPDLYHYYFIDQPSSLVDTSATVTVNFREPISTDPFTTWSLDDPYNRIKDPARYTTRTFSLSPHRLMQFPASGLGSRSEPGALQRALLEVYQAQVTAREAADTLDDLMRRFDRDYQLYSEFRSAYDTANEDAGAKSDQAAANLKAATAYSASAALLGLSGEFITALAEATAEAFPTDAGLAIDATSVARALSFYGGATASYAQGLAGLALETKAAYLQLEADDLSGQADDFLAQYEWDNDDKQHVVEFERLLDDILHTGFDLARRMGELQKANEDVSRLVAKGTRILSEREIFRRRAAAVVQGYRTRDLTYRTFRTESLTQYQALYDLAAQYTYLTLGSYDYETGLLGTSAGQAHFDDVVGTRSLGNFKDGLPVASTSATRGDGGLASVLARLQSDWSVAETRLGINNPDTNGTLFSLRQELFRVRTDAATTDDDTAWRQILQQHIMSDLLNDPDVAQYCRNLRQPDGSTVPGIVITFSTTVEQGLNFFGLPLAAGDHAYTPSNFATKIYSTGVVLKGYLGMDPYAIGNPSAGSPASSSANALSATPYVYVIPTGVDSMRAPPLGLNAATIRSWTVKDQAVPLPFNLGQSDFSASEFFTPDGTLNEQLWIPRQHQAFRPVSDPAFFYSTIPSEFTNTRLIGRSVWNTKWKLVIPAYTLLNDEQKGLDRLIQTITDIQLFFRTYSHAAN